MDEKKKDEQVVITLTQQQYRLLHVALSAAESHPAYSMERRHEIGRLGWAIHCQVNKEAAALIS